MFACLSVRSLACLEHAHHTFIFHNTVKRYLIELLHVIQPLHSFFPSRHLFLQLCVWQHLCKTFNWESACHNDNNKVNVLHVRLADLHAAHQNLPFPPKRTLPLKQYQYQGRLCISASVCQISSKSLELRSRYGNFSFVQDGGRRHLGFSKFEIFNIRSGHEGRTT